MQLLTSRAWVLEAHQIQGKYGESAIIEPNLNFVGVAGETSTVPVGIKRRNRLEWCRWHYSRRESSLLQT